MNHLTAATAAPRGAPRPALDDLRRRLTDVRRLERDAVPDHWQGVRLERLWTLAADWRAALLNSFGPHRTVIDGLQPTPRSFV